jgi:AcrR family transcriptional regulator
VKSRNGIDLLNIVKYRNIVTETEPMGTAERRTREKAGMKAKIMDAARELFVRQGYEAVSMRKIAGAIEYSPTAIYVHFRDKAALMMELCQSDFNTLAHVFRDLMAVADPIDRIGKVGHMYVKFAAENPNHYRLMFMTSHADVQGPEVLKEQCAKDPTKNDPNENSYALLLMAVEEGLKQKRFRPEYKDAHLIAQTFWAAVHGVASLEITYRKDPWLHMPPLEQRADAMIEAVIRGLVREPSTKRPRAGKRGLK